MTFELPKEVEFVDRYGDTRKIHRTRHGLKLKREGSTPAIALTTACGDLLGKNIKQARIAAGFTLAQLCFRAGLKGIPKNRMWEIENNTRRQAVQLGTLYAIAGALNVSPCDLMPRIEDVFALAGVVKKIHGPYYVMMDEK